MKDLSISAQFVKGVGPSRLKLLQRLGIQTMEDLLYYLPRRYEDRRKIKSISEVNIGTFETIKGKALAFGEQTTKKGLNIFRMAVGDPTGIIQAIWFNQPYMRDKFRIGEALILYGKVEKFASLQINNPEYEIVTASKGPSIHMSRIVPIYSVTENLNQRWFRNVIKSAIDHYIDGVLETLPYDMRRRNNLMALREAVRNIHFPVSEIVLEKAKHRLIFDEFLLMQTAIALKRAMVKTDLASCSHNIEGDLIKRFREMLPFKFTKSQSKVIKEIESDMKSQRHMNRLLQGDVGSGKTVVALYALILAVKSKYQGALMVPTEVLAEQHYNNMKALLKDMDVKVVLLSGDLTSEERARRRHMIETQEADIVVGTHAIIQEGVRFKRLGLAVIDEQHKFGVMQRAFLKSKSINPDILIMTATPIPRTLALTVYGDLDISVIDELPPGMKNIKTLYFQEIHREKAYRIAGEQARIGRQAYVVYPIIEDSEKLNLRPVLRMHKEIQNLFPDLKVEVLHGRMKSDEKERVMRYFKEAKIDILVS